MTDPASATAADVVNLACEFAAIASQQPAKPAVLFPTGGSGAGRIRYASLTFGELNARLDRFAHGLVAAGVTPGMRVSLMVRPGLDFLPLTYALFKIGAVPVLIDPGMGKRNLLNCIAASRPAAFIGIPRAQLARLLFPRYFASVRLVVTIGPRLGWGGLALGDLLAADVTPYPCVTLAADPAAIIFTTGSTGPPKGVVYTHAMFAAQRRLLQETYGVTAADVDLPAFALFSIFTLAMGCTVVIPDMDQTRPAQVDPRQIVGAITQNGVTLSFGSPALWQPVSRYCVAHGIRLPSLRRVFMAGAPVPVALHERMLEHVLDPGAEVFTPYGATECLPVTSFRGSEVRRETGALTALGRGYCVGAPLPGLTVKILRISDAPLPRWRDVELLPPGQIGEIVVQGPVVSREYFELPDQTARHKIYETDDPAGPFWHRVGDVGYLDEHGRLWMCGRQGHRVETGNRTLFTVCCEAIFNQHPDVARSALVGLGPDRQHQRPVVVIEPQPGRFPRGRRVAEFRAELRALAAGQALTTGLDTFLFHRAFPVDIRHNAKIFREQLAVWAARQVDE